MDYLGYGVNTILITGSQGFLGRAISQKLKSLNVNLILTGRRPQDGIYLCDLNSISEFSALVNYCKPDLIINCAAFVPQSPSDYNNQSCSRNTVKMVKNILTSSSCPVLHISSMTVYGKGSCTDNVYKESDAGGPTSEYGSSKWESELLLKSDPRPTLSIRIPGLYGISKKSGLVYNTLLACKNSRVPTLPKEPVLWSAMHVDDAAEGIKYLLDNNLSGKLINICWGADHKIKEIIDICKKIIGFHGEIVWDSSKPDGMMRKLQSPKILKDSGWEPKINLEDGLSKTINWFMENRDNIRL